MISPAAERLQGCSTTNISSFHNACGQVDGRADLRASMCALTIGVWLDMDTADVLMTRLSSEAEEQAF